MYIRNGANPQFDLATSRVHMFDGAGMLHQVQIRTGIATYSNTLYTPVVSDAVEPVSLCEQTVVLTQADVDAEW